MSISEAKIIQKNNPNNEIEEYFKIYQAQLKRYWKHVEKVVIKKFTTIKPKAPQLPSYYLVFCTNNKEGHSIATNKFDKINDKLQRGDYQDIGKLIKEMRQSQGS